MDGKTHFQQGDMVVLKNNWATVYIFHSLQEDGYATCVSPKGEEVRFLAFILEKYDAVRRFGL